jgi:hypothetical protein
VNNRSSPYDDNGHGSNTAGLAAGDGFFPTSSSGNAISQVSEDFGTISSTGTYLISGMMVNKSAKGHNSGYNYTLVAGNWKHKCYNRIAVPELYRKYVARVPKDSLLYI